MGVNGKPGRVPEEDDGGEASERHRVKFAPPDASSEGEVAELERQLSEALVGQTYRDRRLAQLTDELALKSALLEQAEATVEATKRAGMEHADRLLAQVEQKDVELVDMQAKIDQLLLSRNQLARAFEQAQNAPQKATPRAADADADEQTQRAAGQPGQYEAELAEVRAKLEARESELEAVRLQLADAENGWAKSNTEAGLVGTNEAQITHGLMGRLRAMEAEMASLRLSEKSSEAMQSRNEG
jgi:chromosome segregation ATPase